MAPLSPEVEVLNAAHYFFINFSKLLPYLPLLYSSILKWYVYLFFWNFKTACNLLDYICTNAPLFIRRIQFKLSMCP